MNPTVDNSDQEEVTYEHVSERTQTQLMDSVRCLGQTCHGSYDIHELCVAENNNVSSGSVVI